MRMKTMTLLAVSGLMAASLAYVIPAFAEDAGDIDGEAPMQLAMGDDTAAATDNGTGNAAGTPADSSAAGADSSSNGSNPGPSSSSATSADQQGTPDVASGDDDY